MRVSPWGQRLGSLALALAAMAGLGCGTFGGSVEPPGDIAAFDAFGAISKVRDFVGPGARLLDVKLDGVPSKGLQDLTDKSVGANVKYTFMRPAVNPATPNAPRGARAAAPALERVTVES